MKRMHEPMFYLHLQTMTGQPASLRQTAATWVDSDSWPFPIVVQWSLLEPRLYL